MLVVQREFSRQSHGIAPLKVERKHRIKLRITLLIVYHHSEKFQYNSKHMKNEGRWLIVY